MKQIKSSDDLCRLIFGCPQAEQGLLTVIVKTVILVKRFKMKLSTLLFYGCIDFKRQPLVQEMEIIPVALGLL